MKRRNLVIGNKQVVARYKGEDLIWNSVLYRKVEKGTLYALGRSGLRGTNIIADKGNNIIRVKRFTSSITNEIDKINALSKKNIIFHNWSGSVAISLTTDFSLRKGVELGDEFIDIVFKNAGDYRKVSTTLAISNDSTSSVYYVVVSEKKISLEKYPENTDEKGDKNVFYNAVIRGNRYGDKYILILPSIEGRKGINNIGTITFKSDWLYFEKDINMNGFISGRAGLNTADKDLFLKFGFKDVDGAQTTNGTLSFFDKGAI